MKGVRQHAWDYPAGDSGGSTSRGIAYLAVQLRLGLLSQRVVCAAVGGCNCPTPGGCILSLCPLEGPVVLHLVCIQGGAPWPLRDAPNGSDAGG